MEKPVHYLHLCFIGLLFAAGCATKWEVPREALQAPEFPQVIRYSTMADRCREIETIAEVTDNRCQHHTVGTTWVLESWRVTELAHTVDDNHDFDCVVYLQYVCQFSS